MEWMILPLKRYAEFTGRSRRKEYWMFYLLRILISFVFGILGGSIAGMSASAGTSPNALSSGGFGVVQGLNAIVALALLVPSISVTVRRLHDTNRSGWWILAPLVPLIIGLTALFSSIGAIATLNSSDVAAAMAGGGGIVFGLAMLATLVMGIVVFVFTVLDGTPGPNKFGSDPKGADRDLTNVFS